MCWLRSSLRYDAPAMQNDCSIEHCCDEKLMNQFSGCFAEAASKKYTLEQVSEESDPKWLISGHWLDGIVLFYMEFLTAKEREC